MNLVDLTSGLDRQGWAVISGLLTAEACGSIAALFDAEAQFRSTVVMAQHGFGRGVYRCFACPRQEPIQVLRTRLYQPLAVITNRWHEAMSIEARFPDTQQEFLVRCHTAG